MQQPKSLEEVISEGVKALSTLVRICTDNFDDDEYKLARCFLKRIQTRKFREYWNTLPHISSSQPSPELDANVSGTDTIKLKRNSKPSNDSEAKRNLQQVGSFTIESSKLFDQSGMLKTEGREWSQNIYEVIPS